MIYTGETLQVSEAVSLINQTFEAALPAVLVEGEVSSFKVSKGKWVFFDIKDEESTINCFMPVFHLKTPLEDGMTVKLVGEPKLTQWGRFSLTVKNVAPTGEGSITKAYQILKEKLEKEGIFDPGKKRMLPGFVQNIAVISSEGAAGWEDFKRIVNDRWVGVNINFANVQVQGLASPGQISKAIDYVNKEMPENELIVIIRGGGSADDLAGFNNEQLVKTIAASKIPTVVGVGHETDETLASLAADVNAATPTHAATIIVPEINEFRSSIEESGKLMARHMELVFDSMQLLVSDSVNSIKSYFEDLFANAEQMTRLIKSYNPKDILNRGYSLLRREGGQLLTSPAKLKVGETVMIETDKNNISAEVKNVTKK